MTNTSPKTSYRHAIQQARQTIKSGDRRAARRWAEQAAALDPTQEEPWLIIAALASPRASLEYLKHVLELNPQNRIARKGMHWAIERYRKLPQPTQATLALRTTKVPQSTPRRRTTLYSWAIVLLALLAGALVWFGTPAFSFVSGSQPNLIVLAQGWVGKATYTPTATSTFTPTPTFTATSTPTNTPSITPTFTPTNTQTPAPTETLIPTNEPVEEVPKVFLPPGVKKGELWIDVDLTNQKMQVYQGKNLLNDFLVSTGTWRTPTVTGQYQVYVKYPAADMSGPGYYLPGVPYVMYFYNGYGIHGTYWHNNFGTPMSHGCINLHTDHAEWVYNKASIGTVVNIHY